MTAPTRSEPVTARHLGTAIGLYAAARLVLVLVVATLVVVGADLLGRDVELIVAAVFAVLISMPISLAVFAPLRRRINATVTAFDAQRSAAHAIGEHG